MRIQHTQYYKQKTFELGQLSSAFNNLFNEFGADTKDALFDATYDHEGAREERELTFNDVDAIR